MPASGAREAGCRGTDDRYRQRVTKLKEQWDKRVTEIKTAKEEPGTMSELNVIGLVNEAAGGKATVVCAAGNMPGELLRLWPPEDPKANHLEYGFSCSTAAKA